MANTEAQAPGGSTATGTASGAIDEHARRAVRIGLVSISDRASPGVYEDKGIPSLLEWLGAALTSPWEHQTRLIPDERETISATLVRGGKQTAGGPGPPGGSHP